MTFSGTGEYFLVSIIVFRRMPKFEAPFLSKKYAVYR